MKQALVFVSLLANDRGGIGRMIAASFFDPGSGTLERVVTDGCVRYRAVHEPGKWLMLLSGFGLLRPGARHSMRA